MKPNKSQLADVPPAQQKRKARIQPHTALGVAVSCLAAGAFVAYAATGGDFSFTKSTKSPVPMKSTWTSHVSKTAETAGAKAQLLGNASTSGAKKGGFLLTQAGNSGGGLVSSHSLISDGRSGNNLSEIDLTPNTASDERDASFSPNGEYVAFRSNGVDADGDGKLDATGFSADGKYHIWVGKFQSQVGGATTLDVYQVTGKTTQYLRGYDQYRPTWSPNSRELAFVSSSASVGPTAGEQIYRINLNLQNTGVPQPLQPYALTQILGPKKSPVWSLNSTEIVFSAQTAEFGGAPGNGYDLFRISSNGQSVLISRITGQSTDPGAAANDENPAFSLVQQDAIYFSSNRLAGAGKRIYVIRNDGTGLQQVTDPTLRPVPNIMDSDDFPALSLQGVSRQDRELLAFQSNSLIDSSDTTRDRNIWGVGVDSTLVGAVPTPLTSRFFISVFNSAKDQVLFVNPPVGSTPASKFNVESGANEIPRPEGAVYYQDETGYYVYVSSRSRNRVERLNAVTGNPVPGVGLNNSAFTPNDPVTNPPTKTGREVLSPSGLATDGNYLYVASGKDVTTAVYRYDLRYGEPAGIYGGTAANPIQTARFTFGEPANNPLGTAAQQADGITSISEGIAINRSKTRLYVSNYNRNRINIYALESFTSAVGGPFNETGTTSRLFQAGEWLGEITAPQATSDVDDPDFTPPAELKGPTGLAIGPDMDGDGREDLYVASALTNDVLAFSLDVNGAAQPLATDGTKFKVIVHDYTVTQTVDLPNGVKESRPVGQVSNLSAPEGIRFDQSGNLYVASYGGTSINRYKINGTGATSTWVNDGLSGSSNNAAWIEMPNPLEMKGPSYFDFNPTFSKNYVDFNSPNVAPPLVFTGEQAKPANPNAPDAEDLSAYVITNILSSPNNYDQSDLKTPVYNANGVAQTVNVKEDKSADIEANFGRGDSTGATLRNRVRVVFSSNRTFAPLPSSNFAGAKPSNPNGGPDSNPGLGNPPSNCDLWITASADVDAPVIQPEENNYPMLSPTHERSKFDNVPNSDFGPRTPRDGMTPGKDVKLVLLAKEQGSGLASVSFAFHNAEDVRRFTTDFGGFINDPQLSGYTRREVDPGLWPTVSGFGFDEPGMTLDLTKPRDDRNYYSDAGPVSSTPERQSNAVAGDGIYYLAKKIIAPNTPADYYISVRITDREGNKSTYNLIWGFSTKTFSPTPTNDLFVSDNAAGQRVAIQGRTSEESTGSSRQPVESFYLENWGNVNNDTPYDAGTVVDGANIATSTAVTFDAVDVWRTLCRGPLDQDIISTNYIPSTVTQINPDKFTNGFQTKDKVFANVQRTIIWAAPYAGTAEVEFDIPGSIKEGATKEQLKRLLEGGGRLFLTGRNVLTALDEGGADNTFRGQELYATATGKASLRPSQVATAVLPLSGTNAFPEIAPNGQKREQYSDLQFAHRFTSPIPDYRDASYSHDGIGADGYAAGAGNGVQVFQAYTAPNGEPIGQRIIKKRSTNIDSGLESRVVFFSFNFDGVNRRYTKINNLPVALDMRKDMADGIRIWFKTGVFTGKVVDNAGIDIVNALVVVTATNGSGVKDVYYARTDAEGNYELKGLPAGRTYTATLVFNDRTFDGTPDGVDGDANDRDDLPLDDVNRGYFTANLVVGTVPAGGTINLPEIRAEKISSGSVTGKVYTYSGTGPTDSPLNRALQSPIGDIQVMLTLASTPTNSQAPIYTRITRTSATGAFTFGDAPPGRDLKLILNPKPTDVPSNSDLNNPNVPGETDVKYNSNYGRRVIPLTGDKRRTGNINTVQNDVFVVNDTYVYDPSKTDLASYGTPPVDTAADEKDAEGNSLPVVLTLGEPISGKFTLLAGNDTPVVGAGWEVKLVPTNGANNGVARTVLTKADGTYVFDEVVKGKYNIIGTVPSTLVNGYTNLTAQLLNIDTEILTDVQKTAQDLTATISHIVGAVKVNGQYVSGATVTLVNKNGTPIVYGTTPRKSTTGNVSGSANYFIGFVPGNNLNDDIAAYDEYKLEVRLPAGGESKTSELFTIPLANTVKVVNFNFETSVIKVSVTTAYAGISREGISVQAFKGTTPGPIATTNAAGEVTFTGLDTALYTFKATKTFLGVTSTNSSNNVSITQTNLPTVTVPLRWDSLSGVVKFNGVAKSGAKVQFFRDNTEVTDLATTSDINGKFEAGKNSGSTIARPLAAGTYKVRVSFESDGFTLSKEQTGIVIGPNFLGQIIPLPEFNFKDSYLTGVVKFNNVPTSGFQVQLLEDDGVTPYKDSEGLGRAGTTDANGVYRLNSLPIGLTDYKIGATKTIGSSPAVGVVDGPTVVEGVTQAPVINIVKTGGISGLVRVNGEAAVGARIEVLDKKKKPLPSPVVVTTDANGKYYIFGLDTASVSVSYVLQASYTEGGAVLKPLTKSFKVKGTTYTPAVVNFDFKVTRVKGLVRSNGSPAAGAAITLLDKKGAALKTPVTSTTDANGNYVLSGVKSGTYKVQASLAGSTASVDVKVGNLKTTVAPTIDLSPQELQVTTEFRAGSSTTKIGDAPGATVEILSASGNSLGTGYTKVTDANSRTSFLGLAAGTYRARVTLQGYSTTTTFSVTSGLSTRVLPIVLSQVRDLLQLSESDKLRTTELGGIDIIRASLLIKPKQNVQVNLVASLPAEARFSTGNSVTLTFTPNNWNVEQLVTVVGQQDNVTDGDKAFTIAGSVNSGDPLYSQIPNFTLSGTNFENATLPTTGPTFAANTKTLVSTPFANVAGKITVAETFGTSGFTLYRFNAAGQKRLNAFAGTAPGADWIAMSGSDSLERGRGYLLVTGAAPVTMLIPANPTIFAGDSFAIDVVRNPNFEAQTGDNNVNNGYDLVGFPFDPSTVSGVDILQQAQVLADGVLYPSFLEAVGAGKISNRIYTVDSQGRPVELSPANSTVRPYRGYFVKISTDKVKIILRANPSNSGGSGGSGSSSSSSAAKSSIKAS